MTQKLEKREKKVLINLYAAATDNLYVFREFGRLLKVVDTGDSFVYLSIDDEGIKTSFMNHEKVIAAYVEIGAAYFDEYKIESPVKIAVLKKPLIDYLLRIKAKTRKIEVLLDFDILRIGMPMAGNGASWVETKISLLTDNVPAVPEIKGKVDAKLVTVPDFVEDVVRTISSSDDEVILESTKKIFRAKVLKGMGSYAIYRAIDKDNSICLDYVYNEPSTTKYKGEHFKTLRIGTKFADVCIFELGNEMPLILTYPVPGDGHFRYAVAPIRVED